MDAVGQISEYLESQFVGRRYLKIHQILPLFALIGPSPLPPSELSSLMDTSSQISLKLASGS